MLLGTSSSLVRILSRLYLPSVPFRASLGPVWGKHWPVGVFETMTLRILSVAGEALNFGLRRMETIARVAWLPAVLIMLLQLAVVFSLLSVVAERPITFTDIQSFTAAEHILANNLERGFSTNPVAMMSILGGALFLHMALVASFMAPLIRLAATGEEPSPGVVRLLFGPDALRFLLASILPIGLVSVMLAAPALAMGFYVAKYIFAALSQTVVTFPDVDSLHTVKLATRAQIDGEGGFLSYLQFGLPALAAAPFTALLWFLLFQHFHPKNRPSAQGRGNWLLRAVATGLGTALFFAAVYFVLSKDIVAVVKSAAPALGQQGLTQLAGPVNTGVFLLSAFGGLFAYLNLRFYAYPGLAVGSGTLKLDGLLELTRGWNLLRMLGVVLLVGLFLGVIQGVVINGLFFDFFLPWVVTTLYRAAAVSTKLINSGVTSEWVAPTFIWIWNLTKLGVNILWTFFSYGVIAGLYGRLYREAKP